MNYLPIVILLRNLRQRGTSQRIQLMRMNYVPISYINYFLGSCFGMSIIYGVDRIREPSLSVANRHWTLCVSTDCLNNVRILNGLTCCFSVYMTSCCVESVV